MPMKDAGNVPDNCVLMVRYGPKGEVEFIFVDEHGDDRLDDLGALQIVPIEGKSALRYPLFMADNIQAEHGWGPFLMDVAMEWVTARRAMLYPHPTGIVPDAKVMWTKYLNERPDVDKEAMTEKEIAALGIKHDEPELRHFYQKDPVAIIALVKQRKWLDMI